MRMQITSWSSILARLGFRTSRTKSKQRRHWYSHTTAIEGLEPRQMLAATQVIDNKGVGFSAPGWTEFGRYTNNVRQGYLDTIHFHAAGSGNSTATWTFLNLSPGELYQVSATWHPGSNRATNSPFSVNGGAPAAVNQQRAPNDFTDLGVGWEHLAAVEPDANGQIIVTLSDAANQYVIADAVRIDPVTEPEIQVSVDGGTLDDGASTVNYGTTPRLFDVTKTFTVTNVGAGQLDLSNLTVPAGFTITDPPNPTSLTTGQSATFGVRFDATQVGPTSGQISLASNDENENPFNFNVTGNVTSGAIIDDGEAGFSAPGFTNFNYQGYKNDIKYSAAHSGRTASWTFHNLDPAAVYRVSATWHAHSNRATNSPYSINGGPTIRVNQRSAPNDFSDQGVGWEDLGGTVPNADGTITVTLSDDANKYVIADAVRIERIEDPEILVLLDGAPLNSGTSVVNFGTTARLFDLSKTFTVTNVGAGTLDLSNLNLPAEYTLTSPLSSTALSHGQSASFEIRFDAVTVGTIGGTVSLTSNDSDENPFTFTVTGNVTPGKIIDDGDPGFSAPGFVNFAHQGYQDDIKYSAANSGRTASWTFNNLDPAAAYRVSATWHAHYDNRATNSPYAINGGPPITINQLVWPDDFSDQGVGWKDLGGTRPDADGTITVTLSDAANDYVIADAVRIERMEQPEILVTAGTSPLHDGGSVVNFGVSARLLEVTKTFTVTNIGAGLLNLSQPVLPAGFLLHSPLDNLVLAAGESTTFEIAYTAPQLGVTSGEVVLANSDSDESEFTFTVTGTGEALIIDNFEPGYVEQVGTWHGPDGHGYKGNDRWSFDGGVAVYTFNIPDGLYRIGATWKPETAVIGGSNQVHYTIDGGAGDPEVVAVNQQQWPDQILYKGYYWNDLGGTSFRDIPAGVHAVVGNQLIVTVQDGSGNPHYAVHADAIKVERVSRSTGTVLVEHSDFVAESREPIVIPGGSASISVPFANLLFDLTDQQSINDALELALVNDQGDPLVGTIAMDRDAFFNVTEGEPARIAAGAVYDETIGEVTVDVSHLPAGQEAFLVARLVNNDSDTTTSVRILPAELQTPSTVANPATTTPIVTHALAPEFQLPIDESRLEDVTASMTIDYHQTTFAEAADVLRAEARITNSGTYHVRRHLLVAVTNIDQPLVQAQGIDGVLADGTPYYNITDLALADPDDTFAPNESTTNFFIEFANPQHVQFDYDLVVLGYVNEAPLFETEPAEQVVAGRVYAYPSSASDADDDPLTYQLVFGPTGMAVDPSSGLVTWETDAADVGSHAVLIRVADPFGATDDQAFVVNVVDGIPNRPPIITSPPVVDAYVNTPYEYQAEAFDADGDALSFALLSGPNGLAIDDPAAGFVTWTPPAELVHQWIAVEIAVSDGNGGEALQQYEIRVHPEPGNHDPVILSEPTIEITSPGVANSATGDVNPNRIQLELAPGETSEQVVSVTVGSAVPKVDVFLLFDDTSSFADTAPTLINEFPTVISEVEAALPHIDFGFGVGRFEEYAGYPDYPHNEYFTGRPFILNQPIVPTSLPGFDDAIGQALNRTAPGYGGDLPETLIEALFQTASGVGFDGNNDGDTTDSGIVGTIQTQVDPGISGDVPAFEANGQFVLNGPGTLGGAGFRAGAVPIILAATDAGTAFQFKLYPGSLHWVYGVNNVKLLSSQFESGSRNTTPGYRGATIQEAISALVDLGALVIGLGTNTGAGSAPRQTLEAVATLTGAVNGSSESISSGISSDPIDPGDPLYFRITAGSGSSVANGISAAIQSAISHVRFDVDVIASNDGVTIENLTGIAGSVMPGETPQFDVRFTGDGQAQSFDLQFVRAGTNVVLGSIPVTINNNYQYDVEALDPDDDVLTYELVGDDHGATIDPQTGALRWSNPAPGNYEFTVRVTDGRGGEDSQTWTVTIHETGADNDDPTITPIENQALETGRPFTLTAEASDPNGDPLSYFLVGPEAGGNQLPSGITMNRFTGHIDWTLATEHVGTHTITLLVTDGRGGQATEQFEITVDPPQRFMNADPNITSLPLTIAVTDDLYRYDVLAHDVDGDPLHYSLTIAPEGMAIEPETGVIVWQPDSNALGEHTVIVRVTDALGGVALQVYTLTVLLNAPPVITTSPVRTVQVNQPYNYDVDADDLNPADVAALTFSLPIKPDNMEIDPHSGIIEWLPQQAGVFDVTVQVSDPKHAYALQSFVVQVIDPATPNRQPQITSVPRDRIRFGRTLFHRLTAFDPDGDSVEFFLESGPDGMSVTPEGLLDWTPVSSQITDPGSPHAYVIRARDSRGAETDAEFQIHVGTELHNASPKIESTPVFSAVSSVLYQYQAVATDPDNDTLFWHLLRYPSGMQVDVQTGRVTWVPAESQIGEHEVALRVTDSVGDGHIQVYTVMVRGVNRPPLVTSSPGTLATVGEPYSYDIEAIDPDGQPVSFDLVNQDVLPSNFEFDPVEGRITWIPEAEDSIFPIVSVSDPDGATVEQHFQILVRSANVNRPPTLSVEPNFFAVIGEPYELPIVASDPDGDDLTFSLHDEPDGMHFSEDVLSPAARIEWDLASAVAGQQFSPVIEVSDGQSSAFYTFTLYVLENAAPVLAPIPAGVVEVGNRFAFDVTATDPDLNPLTFTIDGAPEGMAIDDLGRIRWQTSAGDVGIIEEISVTVTDTLGASATQSFDLTVTADVTPPEVRIIPSADPVNVNSQVTILALASDNVGVESLVLKVAGLPVPLDADGRATITVDTLGELDVTATATDSAGNIGTADATIAVIDPNDLAVPVVDLSGPDERAVITSPTDVVGSISDADSDPASVTYVLEYAPLGGGDYRPFANGSGFFDSGVLGRFDPTILANGLYKIRLTATDAGGHSSSTSRTVEVDGALKLGNFNLSFVDLEVPVSGIPITLTRSYDTLRALEQADFGYGWRLDITATRAEVDYGYDTQLVGPGVSTSYPAFVDGTRVTVTLPDGTREGFTFAPIPAVQIPGAVTEWLPRFVPDPGVQSTLEASEPFLRKSNFGDGSYISLEHGSSYPPLDRKFGNVFSLTTRSGIEYLIEATSGDLRTVVDRAGNTLSFTDAGVQSSAGRGITFERDFSNRITAIIDPAGNRLEYKYDGAGDLVAVTDRVGAKVEFSYLSEPKHYLDTIDDPLGRPAVRTEYDDAGRIQRVTDADGQVTEYEWNLDTSIQKVTDALDNTTIIETDPRGNVVREEDPAGGIKLYTYDWNDNQQTETIVIGLIDSPENGETDDLTTTFVYNSHDERVETIDPRGNVTRTEYNQYGQPTAAIDALGVAARTDYDDRGLPTMFRDANGKKTTVRYDESGNPTKVYNDDGELLVHNAYNSFGDVTSTTGESGSTIYFDYDVNGDQVATWYFEGTGTDEIQILSLTEFDKAQRIVGTSRAVLPAGQFITTDPANAAIDPQYLQWTTSTTFNLSGQIAAASDQFGNTTENTYDVRGLRIQSRVESIDESGNTVWLVTRTVYDAVGRVTHATRPYVEGTTEPIRGTITSYDAAGRVKQTTQTLGMVIGIVGTGASMTSVVSNTGTTVTTEETNYDGAGRTLNTTDANGLQSQTTYNVYGDVIETRSQAIDENGQMVWLVSRTVYDKYGRATVRTDRYAEGSGDTIYGSQTIYDDRDRAIKTVRLRGVQIDVVDLATGLPANPLMSGLLSLDAQLVAIGIELFSSETIYNAKGQVAHTIAADGQVTDYEYDSHGRQTTTIGHAVPAESVSLEQYAGSTVRLRSETEFDGDGRVEIERTNVIQIIDAAGDVTIDDSNQRETRYAYDEFGNRTRTTFADGSYVLLRFDEFGQQVAEMQQTAGDVAAVWSETDQSFVVDGSIPVQTIPTKLFEYDGHGRLVAVELPAVANPDSGGAFERPRYEYGYDAQGNQTLIRDPLGHETRFTFDVAGQQLTRTLPLGFGPDGIRGTPDDTDLPEGNFSERFEYDDRGRQTLHVSFEGVVTRSIYDPQTGRLSTKDFFQDEFQYDDGSGLSSEIWTYKYDAFGRQLEVVQDRDGNLATDADQRVTTNSYDDQGRLVQVSNAEGVIVYDYDDLGRKTATKVYPAGADPSTDAPERVTTYGHDELGRLATVVEDLDPASTEDDPLTTGYGYDLLGNLDRTDLPNGVIEDFVYDELNRLDKLTHHAPDGSVRPGSPDPDLSNNPKLAEFDYTVRADGKRKSVTEMFWLDDDNDPITPAVPHASQVEWTYDELGRLVDEVFDHFDDTLDQTEHFVYDLAGNRRHFTTDKGNDDSIDEAVSYLFDVNDRLKTESKDLGDGGTVDQTTTYGYDHTQQTNKNVSDAIGSPLSAFRYSYDLQGRMSDVVIDSLTGGSITRRERVTYGYDATGIRVSSLHEVDGDADGTYESSTRTEFVVDHRNFTGYQQTIKETTYDEEGKIEKTVEYTIGHDEIAQTVTDYDDSGNVVGEPQTHVFGHDGHGSVRVLYDMAAAVAQVFAFDAYGQLTAMHNGAAQFISADSVDSLTNVLYSGEHFDAKIKQQYLRARFYDPATGRFNRLDPFGGNRQDPQSLHKYLYTHGDPLNSVDPSGEFILAGLTVGSLIRASIWGAGIGAVTGFAFGFTDAVLGGAKFGDAVYAGLETAGWGTLIGAVSGPLWLTAVAGTGALQTAAIILVVYERSAGLALGFTSAAMAPTPQQGIFRGVTSYASGWIALLGLRGIRFTSVGTAAQTRAKAYDARDEFATQLRVRRDHPPQSGAAYDIATGRIVTAQVLKEGAPRQIHPDLLRIAEPLGGVRAQVPCGDKTITVGNCWEFRAANQLLYMGSRIENIRFTRSIRPRDGAEFGACHVCRQMFGDGAFQ